MVAPHAARELGAHDGAALVDLDVVLAATEGVLNHALHFEEITLAHVPRCERGGNLTQPGPPGKHVPLPTLFDYNGVLVDDEDVHFEAFCDVLRPLGVVVSERAYRERYLGFDDVGAFRAMLADAGREVTPELVRDLVEAKKPLYLARAETALRAFEGAARLVVRRAELGPVGIVSGALAGEIALGLQLLGVAHAVDFVISAEDTTACKPDPQGYLLGRERLGGARAIVIEDSLAGVEAAKAAGLPCIGVAHSYAIDELRRAGADLAVERIAELTDAHFAELEHA